MNKTDPKGVRPMLAALFVYLLAYAVLLWPLPLRMSTSIFGNFGDSTASIADLWFWRTEGYRVIGQQHTKLIGAPLGVTLNQSPYLTSVVLTLPAFLLSFALPDVFVYNALILSGLILTSLATYFLCLSLRLRPIIGIWVGFVFGACPYRILGATSWYSQTHMEAIPLTLLFLHRWFTDRRRRDGAFVCASVILGLATNAYVGLMCVIIVAVGIVLYISSVVFSQERRNITQVLQFTLALLSFVAIAVLVARQLVGLESARQAHELRIYGLRIVEIYRPTIYSTFYRWLGLPSPPNDTHGSNYVEISQFYGYTIPVLGGVGFLLANRLRIRRSLLAGVVLMALLLAVSQGYELFGLVLPSVSSAIFWAVPYWRVFSRFAVLAFLALAVLAGVALQIGTVSRRPAIRIAVCLACLFAVVELHISPPIQNSLTTAPRAFTHLATFGNGPVAAYPIKPWFDPATYDLRFWQRIFERPILNGGNGQSEAEQLQETVKSLEDPTVVETLQALKISTIIVDRPEYVRLYGRAPQLSAKKKKSFGRYTLYELSERQNAVASWFTEGTLLADVAGDGRVWRWTNQNPGFRVLARVTGCFQLKFSVGSFDRPAEDVEVRVGQARVKTARQGNDRVAYVFLKSGINKGNLASKQSLVTLPDGRSAAIYVSNFKFRKSDSDHCPN